MDIIYSVFLRKYVFISCILGLAIFAFYAFKKKENYLWYFIYSVSLTPFILLLISAIRVSIYGYSLGEGGIGVGVIYLCYAFSFQWYVFLFALFLIVISKLVLYYKKREKKKDSK